MCQIYVICIFLTLFFSHALQQLMHRSRPKSNLPRHTHAHKATISFSQDPAGLGTPEINGQGSSSSGQSGFSQPVTASSRRRKHSRSNERKEDIAADFKQEPFEDEDEQERGELEIDEEVTQEEINDREKKRRKKGNGGGGAGGGRFQIKLI